LNGGNVAFKDVFTKIALNFGKKPPHKKVTKILAAIVWRVEGIRGLFSGKKPLLTKETAATAQTIVHYDNSKLLKALPDFSYTPIDATLKRICQELHKKYEL